MYELGQNWGYQNSETSEPCRKIWHEWLVITSATWPSKTNRSPQWGRPGKWVKYHSRVVFIFLLFFVTTIFARVPRLNVAQWLEHWSLTGQLSGPTLDLQLTGDHLCGWAVRYIGQPTRLTQPFILQRSINWVVSYIICVPPRSGGATWWMLTE